MSTVARPPADPAEVEEVESRWEAAPAVVAVMALQVAIALFARAGHWSLWIVPWWAWLVCVIPEAVLLVPLVVDRTRHALDRLGRRELVVRALFGIVTAANGLLLAAVLASLIAGREQSGAQLLVKALTVWTTNTITYGLWFWAVDRGGPAQRLSAEPPPPDFLFPQLGDQSVAAPGWYPGLFDYL